MAFGVQGFGFNTQFNSVSSFSGSGFQSGGVPFSNASASAFQVQQTLTTLMSALQQLQGNWGGIVGGGFPGQPSFGSGQGFAPSQPNFLSGNGFAPSQPNFLSGSGFAPFQPAFGSGSGFSPLQPPFGSGSGFAPFQPIFLPFPGI